MFQRVWNAAVDAVGNSRVTIATDSAEIADLARGFGARVGMTSEDATCGTERVAELANGLNADALVNVQADDPFVTPELIQESLDAFYDRGLGVCTPVFRLDAAEAGNSNVVKVVRSSSGRALYFSRAQIPYDRDGQPSTSLESGPFWGHVGLYVYSPDAVIAYQSFGRSELEDREKLEQLRFLVADIPIATFVTEYRPRAVDVPEDLEALEKELSS
jgi:3-deoxy-manno-octulosonate cytidylyltransferase (CMP-KDO synthetase)